MGTKMPTWLPHDGLRFAVKRGSTLYHVHGNHLGSTPLTTAGAVEEGSRAYHPYGSERSASGTLHTDRTFTGQKEDGTGLLYYNARYYDPALGAFISPDSLVPDAGMVIDYNRFLYARGNPLKYSDPTGYDPLDRNWEREFIQANRRQPTDRDRRDRLFSLLFPGSGPGGSWIDSDWRTYSEDRRLYWTGLDWPGAMKSGLNRFATHVEHLASFYGPDETDAFVKAFGFLFGGIPLSHSVTRFWITLRISNPLFSAIDMAFPVEDWNAEWPLEEGDKGWDQIFMEVGDPNPAHHYAGLFYMGYWFGRIPGELTNWARDAVIGWNPPDIRLGDLAARHGSELRSGRFTIHQLGTHIANSLDPSPDGYWNQRRRSRGGR